LSTQRCREAEAIPCAPELSHRYSEIHAACVAILQAVWDAHAEAIVKMFGALTDACKEANKTNPNTPSKTVVATDDEFGHTNDFLEHMHTRALRHHLFAIIRAGRAGSALPGRRDKFQLSLSVSRIAQQIMNETPFQSDKTFGLAAYLATESDAAKRSATLAAVKQQAATHPLSIENFIAVVSAADCDDAPTFIRQLLEDESFFNINLSGHARTLCRGWSSLRRRSLLSPAGLDLTVELFVRIANVNQMSAQSIVQAFNDLPKFAAAQQKPLVAALRKMRAGIHPVRQESLRNQLNRILEAYPEEEQEKAEESA
jgi:hypothetical protein